LQFVLLAVAAFAGCDLTGQYEKKFQETLQVAPRRALFDLKLYPNFTEVMDAGRKNAGVKLRIPNLFDNSGKALPTNDPRAEPPFLTLPGLSYVVERQLDDATGQWLPAYVYFAAVPRAEQKADALQAALVQQAAKIQAGATWSEVPISTRDGTTMTLKRLRVEGKQDFANLQKNPPVKVTVDGRLDLYFIEAGEHHVLVGWRAPLGQAQKNQFDTVSEAAMGTVEIAEPPAGAAKGGGKAAGGCG